MADLAAAIETREHQWLRAWINRDDRTIRKMTARDFRFVFGAKRALLLDRKSLLGARRDEFSCSGYRFGQVYVRRHKKVALFSTQVDLEMTLAGADWNGTFWLTDLWMKGRLPGGWQLIERQLSRPETDETVPKAIKTLQLWHG